MNLTIDIGNTRLKWALFEGDRLVLTGMGEPLPEAERVIVSATGHSEGLKVRNADGGEPLNLSTLIAQQKPLPIALDYATPQTLGADRVAAACGAWKVAEGQPCVIVDAGTCITIDYLDAAGVYRGGAILPGILMKFRALHTFTAKLPLLENVKERYVVTGRTTEESMAAGVLTATRYAVEGFVRHYREKDTRVQVLLTGGDAAWLAAGEGEVWKGCRVEPQLVMTGLNAILINCMK